MCTRSLGEEKKGGRHGEERRESRRGGLPKGRVRRRDGTDQGYVMPGISSIFLQPLVFKMLKKGNGRSMQQVFFKWSNAAITATDNMHYNFVVF